MHRDAHTHWPPGPYPVLLGDSFRPDPPTRYFYLQYAFKPASADQQQSGRLSAEARTGQAVVELGGSAEGLQFRGPVAACRDVECLLVFEPPGPAQPARFRLERFAAAARALRRERPASVPAATGGGAAPPAATASTVLPPPGAKRSRFEPPPAAAHVALPTEDDGGDELAALLSAELSSPTRP